MTPAQALARLRVRQQTERAEMVERHEIERIKFLDRQRRELRDLALRQESERTFARTAEPIGQSHTEPTRLSPLDSSDNVARAERVGGQCPGAMSRGVSRIGKREA